MRNDVDDVGNVFSVAQSRIVNKVDMKYGFGVKTDDIGLWGNGSIESELDSTEVIQSRNRMSCFVNPDMR